MEKIQNKENNENILYIIGKEEDNTTLKKDLGLGENTNPHEIEIQNKWNVNQINTNNFSETNPYYPQISEKIIELISQNTYDDDFIYSFTIIYIVYNLKKQNDDITLLLQTIQNSSKNNYYLPFVIFLFNTDKEDDKNSLEKIINTNELFRKIDKRNISYFIYPLNMKQNLQKDELIKEIFNKLYKIYSYFYGLGDELYKVKNEELCPINILILGGTQQGKTTFINTITKSKKGREGCGSSETKGQIIYHIDNIPLCIYDIEGFNGEDTINNVVEKIKLMQNLKDEKEISLVIYIIKYEKDVFFLDNEYKIFKQLAKKLNNMKFLFVITKTNKNEIDNDDKRKEKIMYIQRNFMKMLNNGIKKDKENKKNNFNVMDYLYMCQKCKIDFNEINSKEITEKEFESKNFIEKMKLKFDSIPTTKKNEEIINTIIKDNETIMFVNLIEEENCPIKFGMNAICKKMANLLENIKINKIKALNDCLIFNKDKIIEIKEIANNLKKISETKEDRDIIIEIKEEKLLNEIDKEEKKIESIKFKAENFEDLLNSFDNKNKDKVQSDFEKYLKNKVQQIQEIAKSNVKVKIIWGTLSGIIPFIDIFIQKNLTKQAKEIIAKHFGDDLIDFDIIDNIKNSSFNDDKKEIEKLEKKTCHDVGDFCKTGYKCVTIYCDLAPKLVEGGWKVCLAGTGIGIGTIMGYIRMKTDVNAYIEFYTKRFVFRNLVYFSFDDVEKYLRQENFE